MSTNLNAHSSIHKFTNTGHVMSRQSPRWPNCNTIPWSFPVQQDQPPWLLLWQWLGWCGLLSTCSETSHTAKGLNCALNVTIIQQNVFKGNLGWWSIFEAMCCKVRMVECVVRFGWLKVLGGLELAYCSPTSPQNKHHLKSHIQKHTLHQAEKQSPQKQVNR